MQPDDFMAPIGEGGRAAEQGLAIAAVGLAVFCLVALAVWAILFLRGKPDRWALSGAAVTLGGTLYLLWYAYMTGPL